MSAETRSQENGRLRVRPGALTRLREEARLAEPAECCGVLLGGGGQIEGILPAANVAGDPRHRFEIDPQLLVDAYRAARAGGPQVLGYYHSHPSGSAKPSVTDRAMAARDGSIWAIVAGDDVRFWRDGETGFTELSWDASGI